MTNKDAMWWATYNAAVTGILSTSRAADVLVCGTLEGFLGSTHLIATGMANLAHADRSRGEDAGEES